MTIHVFCLHFPVWYPCWACYRVTDKDQKCLNFLTVANLPYFNWSCYQFEKIPSRTHQTRITASLETNSWHFSFQCGYLINHIFWKPLLCNSILRCIKDWVCKYLIQKVRGVVYLRKKTCDKYKTWPWPLSCWNSIFDIDVSMATHCMTNQGFTSGFVV